MIKGLAHLAFLVSDIEASLDFYVDVLGFKKKFTLNDPDGRPWIVYVQINDNQFIELFPSQKPLVENKPSSYQHLCLEVDDIQATATALENKGIMLDQPIIRGMDNNYQCWIHDPDGNPIELMEYGEESLQLRD